MQIICLFGSPEKYTDPSHLHATACSHAMEGSSTSNLLRLQCFKYQIANLNNPGSDEGADMAQDDSVLKRVLNVSCLPATQAAMPEPVWVP